MEFSIVDDICCKISAGAHTILQNIQRLFKEKGLKINFVKCLFSQKKLKLSGLAFSKDDMHPDSIQFTEIQTVPTAEDTKALQSFLRLMTYFKCFIPQHSTLSYPLTSSQEFQKLVDKYMPDRFRQPQICSYLTILCRILQYKQRSYHLY